MKHLSIARRTWSRYRHQTRRVLRNVNRNNIYSTRNISVTAFVTSLSLISVFCFLLTLTTSTIHVWQCDDRWHTRSTIYYGWTIPSSDHMAHRSTSDCRGHRARYFNSRFLGMRRSGVADGVVSTFVGRWLVARGPTASSGRAYHRRLTHHLGARL